MGEHIDKLSEDVVALGALEKVRSYFRTINGKKVKVSGHARKGDGPNHRADFKNFSQQADASGYKDRPSSLGNYKKSSKADTDAEKAAYGKGKSKDRQFLDKLPSEEEKTKRAADMLTWDEDQMTPAERAAHEKRRADRAVKGALDKIKAKQQAGSERPKAVSRYDEDFFDAPEGPRKVTRGDVDSYPGKLLSDKYRNMRMHEDEIKKRRAAQKKR